MASPRKRVYSRTTRDAVELLGKLIRLGRKDRRLTESDLAGRAGISRKTLQKIESGNPKCEIGLVFELAILVGVKLFEEALPEMATHLGRIEDKLSLLPQRVRPPVKVDDDF